ncbi:rCG51113 [Rattus norvegicus]|uniref:RCG51113 n=1 Tax=Rattus norvegicus TaxID=10116 RepID=A6IYK3_RAT|nr:rCG51113 [Rattus norvegicus]
MFLRLYSILRKLIVRGSHCGAELETAFFSSEDFPFVFRGKVGSPLEKDRIGNLCLDFSQLLEFRVLRRNFSA